MLEIGKNKIDNLSWQAELVSFLDKTNDPVNNWKNDYVGKKGTVYLSVSSSVRPGEIYALFYPDNSKSENEIENLLAISPGQCDLQKDGIKLTTLNSVYKFKLYKDRNEGEYIDE